MPRRREVPKREVLPDPKYRETDVSKFINVVMLHGKKAVAEGIETTDQQEICKDLGIQFAQGFLYSPGLPPEKFVDWVKSHDNDGRSDNG